MIERVELVLEEAGEMLAKMTNKTSFEWQAHFSSAKLQIFGTMLMKSDRQVRVHQALAQTIVDHQCVWHIPNGVELARIRRIRNSSI